MDESIQSKKAVFQVNGDRYTSLFTKENTFGFLLPPMTTSFLFSRGLLLQGEFSPLEQILSLY